MDQQDKLEKNGRDTGIRKFREKVKEENGSFLKFPPYPFGNIFCNRSRVQRLRVQRFRV
jgi:hypothetical protein